MKVFDYEDIQLIPNKCIVNSRYGKMRDIGGQDEEGAEKEGGQETTY